MKRSVLITGFFKYSAGICRASGLTFEVDTQVGYIEYVSYVYLFQVQAYGVLRLFGYGSVDLQVTLFMAEVEIVDVHFARVDHDLRRVYLPYGVV